MTVTVSSPEGMLPDAPYHHIAVATGTRQVYVAGQVAHMPDGSPIPTDLAGQVSQALRNVARRLAGAGAGFDEVVRLTFYVTDWQPEKIDEFMAGVEAVADEIGLSTPMPPASLIGAEILFEPGVLVEIEATAVLDWSRPGSDGGQTPTYPAAGIGGAGAWVTPVWPVRRYSTTASSTIVFPLATCPWSPPSTVSTCAPMRSASASAP